MDEESGELDVTGFGWAQESMYLVGVHSGAT